MPPQQNQVPPIPPQQYVPISTQPSQTLAIVALVLGIVGLIPWVGVAFAIAAIIVGFIGLSHIKKGIASGHGMALTGTILGFVGLVITALTIGTIIVSFVSAFAGLSHSIPQSSQSSITYPSSVGQ